MNQWKRSIYIRETPRANCASWQVLKHVRNTEGENWKKSNNREATQSSSLGLPHLSCITAMDLGQAQTTFPAFSSHPGPIWYLAVLRDRFIIDVPGLSQIFLEPCVSALSSEESKRDPRISHCLHLSTQPALDFSFKTLSFQTQNTIWPLHTRTKIKR